MSLEKQNKIMHKKAKQDQSQKNKVCNKTIA